jgi:hypothetical protein
MNTESLSRHIGQTLKFCIRHLSGFRESVEIKTEKISLQWSLCDASFMPDHLTKTKRKKQRKKHNGRFARDHKEANLEALSFKNEQLRRQHTRHPSMVQAITIW